MWQATIIVAYILSSNNTICNRQEVALGYLPNNKYIIITEEKTNLLLDLVLYRKLEDTTTEYIAKDDKGVYYFLSMLQLHTRKTHSYRVAIVRLKLIDNSYPRKYVADNFSLFISNDKQLCSNVQQSVIPTVLTIH